MPLEFSSHIAELLMSVIEMLKDLSSPIVHLAGGHPNSDFSGSFSVFLLLLKGQCYGHAVRVSGKRLPNVRPLNKRSPVKNTDKQAIRVH